ETSRHTEDRSRHPNVDMSSSLGRRPRDECYQEGHREWSGGGPEMILRVLSIRLDVAREHRLGRESDRNECEDRPPVLDGPLNPHAVMIDSGARRGGQPTAPRLIPHSSDDFDRAPPGSEAPPPRSSR